MKKNQNGNDLGIGKPSRLIAMLLAITELILFEFRRKILAEIIGKTENFSKICIRNIPFEIKRVRRITSFWGNELATVLIAVVCIALLVWETLTVQRYEKYSD